jgi:predicted LPLAT superfamily acyltransferase
MAEKPKESLTPGEKGPVTQGNGSVTPRKRGNRLGFMIFRIAARAFGLKGAYGLLYFVCLYYVLFDRAAVRSSMPYIKRRFPGRGSIGRRFEAYRLFLSQGRNLIDRFYLVTGAGKFDIDILGYDRIKSILQGPTPKGLVLLTAHVGNWQTSMAGLEKFGRKVHLMMKPEQNEAVREALSVDGGGERIGIISPDGYLGGVLEALKAIREGDFVSIMGDRSYGADTVEVDFLGSKVRFPYGAFSIAASAGCPVVVLLTAKAGPRKYVVDVTTVIDAVYTNRRNRMRDFQRWAGEFASALERYVEKYPYQWFVFHDLWSPRKGGDGDI